MGMGDRGIYIYNITLFSHHFLLETLYTQLLKVIATLLHVGQIFSSSDSGTTRAAYCAAPDVLPNFSPFFAYEMLLKFLIKLETN